MHAVRKDQALADGFVAAQGDDPLHRREARDHPRGGAGPRGHEHGGARHRLQRVPHHRRHRLGRRGRLALTGHCFQIIQPGGRTVRLGVGGDLRQHRHRLLRILAHCRLAREHDAVGAVEDGVGHIRGLGPCGQTAGRHGFEHLRGGDDRLADAAGPGDELLLDHGNLFNRHFHSEIAARHHDAVCRFQNLVEVFEGIRTLDLGDDEGLSADGFRRGPHGFDVRGRFHERLAHGVHPVPEREFQTGAVVVSKRTDAEGNARQIEALPGSQFAADRDFALNIVARHALDDQLHQAVVEEEPVARLHDLGQPIEAHRDPLRGRR